MSRVSRSAEETRSRVLRAAEELARQRESLYQREKLAALVLRIIFAALTTQLLQIVGLIIVLGPIVRPPERDCRRDE